MRCLCLLASGHCLWVGPGQAWAPGPALGETWGRGLQGMGRPAVQGTPASLRVMIALPCRVPLGPGLGGVVLPRRKRSRLMGAGAPQRP